MSLAFADLTFSANHLHGPLTSGQVVQPMQVYRVPGTYGEGHLVDKRKSVILTCNVHFYGYANPSAVATEIDNLNSAIGKDTTITITGPLAGTTPNVTYLGFEQTSEIMFDGSGQNGWHVKGRLTFIRRLES